MMLRMDLSPHCGCQDGLVADDAAVGVVRVDHASDRVP
jgi:hypothetical protein